MPGGELLQYIGNHANADRIGLVGVLPVASIYANRRHQLTDVAKGLCYLHSCNVIHGDLKGVRNCHLFRFTVVFTHCQANILVDDSGHARIADFGLAAITKNSNSIQSAPHQHGFTLRWTAPEVVANREPTKEGDMFSFAMVTIEVGNAAAGPLHGKPRHADC